jgi:hypothetical protein
MSIVLAALDKIGAQAISTLQNTTVALWRGVPLPLVQGLKPDAGHTAVAVQELQDLKG